MEFELWTYAEEIENEYRDLDFDEFEDVLRYIDLVA